MNSNTTLFQNHSNSQSFDIRNHIEKLTPTDQKDRYYCPVCEGHNFTIKEDTGAYQCWNGCEVADIRNAIAPLKEKSERPAGRKPIPKAKVFEPAPIPEGAKLLVSSSLGGIPKSETLTSKPPKGAVGGVEQTIYHYSADQWVVRYQWADASKPKGYAKTFRQFHKNADGSIESNKGSQKWKPYRLDEVLAHILALGVEVPAVLWGEGEKCVEIARAGGILSITLQGSNWSVKAIKEGLQPIVEASPKCVNVFIADGDETGKKKGEKFEKACAEVGLPCIVIPSTSFEVEGDIEEILQSMDVPEFIKRLEEEIHAAALEEAKNEEDVATKLTSKVKEDRNFIHHAIAFFFSENAWICVDNRLHEYRDNYYAEVPDEYLISRVQSYCFNYPVVDKHGETTYPYANSRSAAEVLKLQKNLVTIPVSEINPPGINCTNGILKVEWEGNTPTFSLINHNPIHYYTYPPLVEYNPEADSKQCDRLLKCLDPAQQEVFLRNVSASIDLPTVRRIRGREVKALLLSGLGSNGKDALREVVSTIWGHEGMTSCSLADFQSYDDGRKFSLSALRGSRINWASENPQTSRIDKLQALKLFVTGNKLHAERKGKDHVEFTPTATGLFNVNEVPALQGTMQAIVDRIGVIQFRKTFKKTPDPSNPNEMLADPRFAYDSEFIRNEVAPAFLNKLLQALKDLCEFGIDYGCTEEAFADMQKRNNHLFQFCEDVGLVEDSESSVTASELWEYLESWYKDQGTLTIAENGKREWVEQTRPSDKNVKASSQVCDRLLQIFPNAKKVKTPHPIHGVKKQVTALKGIKFLKPDINDNYPAINENSIQFNGNNIPINENSISINDNRTPINENSTPDAPPTSTPNNPYTAGIAPPPPPISNIASEKNENSKNENSKNEFEKENKNSSTQSKVETPPTGGGGGATPTLTGFGGVLREGAKGVRVSTTGVRLSIKSGDTVFPTSGKYQARECVVGTIDGNNYWVRPANATRGNGQPICYQAHQLNQNKSFQPETETEVTEQLDIFEVGTTYYCNEEEYLDEIDD
ncbi:MAG: heavy metal transporter [Richelia sp. SL_2_1]|nr:heavy metal transporter [Richelia sp. SL_2_1]